MCRLGGTAPPPAQPLGQDHKRKEADHHKGSEIQPPSNTGPEIQYLVLMSRMSPDWNRRGKGRGPAVVARDCTRDEKEYPPRRIEATESVPEAALRRVLKEMPKAVLGHTGSIRLTNGLRHGALESPDMEQERSRAVACSRNVGHCVFMLI